MAIRKYAIQQKGEGWRKELAKHKALWSNRNLDDIHEEIENDVYERALNGEPMRHIALWYGVQTEKFAAIYGDVWVLGHSEFKAAIRDETIKFGFETNQVVGKIWLGKSLGGMAEQPTQVDVDTSGDSNVQVSINVRRRPVELEESIDDAFAERDAREAKDTVSF